MEGSVPRRIGHFEGPGIAPFTVRNPHRHTHNDNLRRLLTLSIKCAKWLPDDIPGTNIF